MKTAPQSTDRRALLGEIAVIRERIRDLREESNFLTHAPLSADDVLEVIRKNLVASQPSATIGLLVDKLRNSAPSLLSESAAYSSCNAIPVLAAVDFDSALVIFARKLEEFDFSDAGPPLATRRQRLAEIAEEIASLEWYHRELQQLAGTAPPGNYRYRPNAREARNA